MPVQRCVDISVNNTHYTQDHKSCHKLGNYNIIAQDIFFYFLSNRSIKKKVIRKLYSTYTVKPALNGPFIKRNFSWTEISLCPVNLGLKQLLNTLD
jgi:hypothetical protein